MQAQVIEQRLAIARAEPSTRNPNHDSLSSPSRRRDPGAERHLLQAAAAGPGLDAVARLPAARAEDPRDAHHVFSTTDVQQKATAVRGVLNELSPYYDPDAVPLQPVMR